MNPHLKAPIAITKEEQIFSQQAERQWLACVLTDPSLLEVEDVGAIRHTHFFDPDLQQVAYAIDRLRDDRKPIVETRVIELVKANGLRNTRELFCEIINSIGTTYAVRTYAEIILENAQRRRQLQLSEEIRRQVSDGLPPEDIDGLLERYLENRRARDVGIAANGGFKLLTCLDVALAPEPEYLAKGLIPRGQPGVIGAPYKGMKTSICCDIAASLATGGYVMGFFRVPQPVRVLFMSAESGLPTLRKTTEAICNAAGIRWPEDLDNLQWCTTLPKLGIDDDLRKLDAAFASFPFEVLIADPLFKMCSGDGAENMMKQGDKFMHLQKWCDERGVTLIFVHHLTKPASKVYEPADLGDLSYAGIAEHVRWWILLSRQEKYTPPDPVHRLWFGCGGSAGHSGLWACSIDLGEYVEGQPRQWNVTLQEAQEVRQEAAEKRAAAKNAEKLTAAQAKAQANVESLLSTLKEFPEGETKTALRNRSGLHTSALDGAIYDALHAKPLPLIESCQVFKGGRKQGRDGYRLAPSGASGASGKNAGCPDAPNDQSIGEGKPLLKEGFPVPMVSAAMVNESEQSIGEEAA